jgi:hypothetical protein
MDIEFDNNKVMLGASIEPMETGYALLSLRLSEKNLLGILDHFTAVIGAVELNLSNRQVEEFRMEMVQCLRTIYEARRLIGATVALHPEIDEMPPTDSLH